MSNSVDTPIEFAALALRRYRLIGDPCSYMSEEES